MGLLRPIPFSFLNKHAPEGPDPRPCQPLSRVPAPCPHCGQIAGHPFYLCPSRPFHGIAGVIFPNEKVDHATCCFNSLQQHSAGLKGGKTQPTVLRIFCKALPNFVPPRRCPDACPPPAVSAPLPLNRPTAPLPVFPPGMCRLNLSCVRCSPTSHLLPPTLRPCLKHVACPRPPRCPVFLGGPLF